MNPTAFIGLCGLGTFIGDVFDFAIDKLKAKEVVANLWVSAQTSTWNDTSAKGAFRFAKDYLDRLFGPRLLSIRSLITCLCFSLVVTDASTWAISGKHALFWLLQVAAIYGTADFISLVLSRRLIANVVSSYQIRSLWRSLVKLSLIAYLAMGCVLGVALAVQSGLGLGALVIAPFWLPIVASVAFVSGANIPMFMLALIPGAFTTLLLIVTLAIPYIAIKTRRFSQPFAVTVLDWFGSLPSWTGRAIGLFCGGATAVLKLHQP